MYLGKKRKPFAKRCDRRAAFVFTSQSGISLLIIILSILILAVLAAAMYAITSTSYFNQASSQDAMKALYMAEAGPRVVASEYKMAANKDAKLADLNERTFALTTGGSSNFRIDIYPYWLYAPTALSLPGPNPTTTPIILNLPGGLPLQNKEGTALITFPTSGILKVSGETYEWSFTGALAGATTSTGTPITLNLSRAFNPNNTAEVIATYSLPINSALHIGFVQNESNARIFDPQTVVAPGSSGNRDLILNTTGNIAKFFPPENGEFALFFASGFKNYHYDQRVISDTTTTLTNVQSVACPAANCLPFTVISAGTNSLDVAVNTQIFVGKTTGIRSTGVN